MIKRTFSLPMLAGTLMLSHSALAYEAGNILIRSGIVVVDPQEKSSDIQITAPGLGAVTGAKVGVDSDAQLGLSATYLVTNRIGVEVLAATPFAHNIMAAGALAGAGKLGEAKHLPPTVSVQYYFLDPASSVQPYAGLGLNYTLFFEESTTNTLTGAIGTLASLKGVSGVTATSSKLKLDDSVGVAAQLGVDYRITDNFGINAALWWIDIDTTGTITANTNLGLVKAKVDVEIDPMVYMVGAYVKF